MAMQTTESSQEPEDRNPATRRAAPWRLWTTIVAAATLTACGGGGSGSSPAAAQQVTPTAPPPFVAGEFAPSQNFRNTCADPRSGNGFIGQIISRGGDDAFAQLFGQALHIRDPRRNVRPL